MRPEPRGNAGTPVPLAGKNIRPRARHGFTCGRAHVRASHVGPPAGVRWVERAVPRGAMARAVLEAAPSSSRGEVPGERFEMVRRLRMLGMVGLMAAGCAGTQGGGRPTARPEPGEYRIGREDVLEVVVWHEPELTRVVPVRPDGRISLPLAGEVEAAGKTPQELQAGLSRLLEPFIHDTRVAVLVREINGAKTFVLGEVTKPGGFPLRGPMSVMQAIAVAGGRTEFAKDEVVWLRQMAGGKTERVSLSFRELVQGEAAGALWLRPGDVLYVP